MLTSATEMGKAPSKRTKLAPRQALFVAEYAKDLNATQAAIRAGYSKHSAAIAGSKMLKVPKIAAALESLQADRAERTGVTQDRIVNELARIAFADIAGAFDANGNLLPVSQMPEDVRRAMSGLDTEEFQRDDGLAGRARRIRSWDKVKAIELLMRHNGMLRDKVELSGKDGEALSISIDLGGGK